MSRKKKTKVFVSYSRHDEALVKPLAGLLGVASNDAVFLDIDSLKPGDLWEEEIITAVTNSSVFVLCWCCESEKSEFVSKEISTALVDSQKRLVPVLFCSTNLPSSLRSKQWIDLRGKVVHVCNETHEAELARLRKEEDERKRYEYEQRIAREAADGAAKDTEEKGHVVRENTTAYSADAYSIILRRGPGGVAPQSPLTRPKRVHGSGCLSFIVRLFVFAAKVAAAIALLVFGDLSLATMRPQTRGYVSRSIPWLVALIAFYFLATRIRRKVSEGRIKQADDIARRARSYFENLATGH